MLHRIDSNEGPCTTEPCLTVNSDGSPFCLSDSQKLLDNVVRRRRAINEEEVGVVDRGSSELSPIVFRFIQPDHVSDPEVLKYLNIVFGSVAPLRLTGRGIDRPHEGNELVGLNPVKIAVLHSLVVFILFVIEVSELIPAQTDRELKTLQAVEDSTLVGARIPVTRISERLET